MTHFRLVFAAALAATAVLLASACSGESTAEVTTAHARAVTAEESQALAMTRVRNLEAGARTVTFEVEDKGTLVSFDGWFDYMNATGYGLLTSTDSTHLIQWNHDGIAAATWEDAEPPLPVPATDNPDVRWSSGPLDPSSSRVHSTLAIVAALGSDRPDNPLLLTGSGALWLAERTLEETELMVLSGPPSEEALPPGESADPHAATIRYWIEDSGLAHRVQVRTGGDDWMSVEFGPAEGVSIESPTTQSDNSL